jgi:hypothetical protein
MNNFIGKDDFTWWVGVVERIDDPLEVGRCRVRIFGWHTDDLQKLPTEDLPWALPLNSPNSAKGFSTFREGDFVMGFFQDGMSAQAPVVMGVFAGLDPISVDTNRGFSPQGPKENVPALPAGQIAHQPGQPTTPPLARGIVANTAVSQANDNLAHVCDFVSEMQKNIELKKFLKSIANKIREGIRAVMRALGFTDATGQYSWLIDKLKSFARELKRIQKEIIQPIIDFEKYVLSYITKIRAMIQWILSLPQRFITLLRECLDRLLALVGNVFSDFMAELSPGGVGQNVQDLIAASKEATNEISKTIQLASVAVAGAVAIPAAATAGLLLPANQSELDEANKTIAAYISTTSSTIPQPEQNKSVP